MNQRIEHVGSQYGLINYAHYRRIIPKDVGSIGILTQSLEANCTQWTTRRAECQFVPLCQIVTDHLATYLRAAFPSAEVSVRAGEPVPMVYTRLVFAPVATICNPSTFCLWPTIASNSGYLPYTTLFRHASKAAQRLDSLHMIPEEPSYLGYNTLHKVYHNVTRFVGTLDKRLLPPPGLELQQSGVQGPR